MAGQTEQSLSNPPVVDSQEPESVVNGKDLLSLNVLVLDRTGAIDAEVMLFFILVIFER